MKTIVVLSPEAKRFDVTLHYWQADFSAVAGYLRDRFPDYQIRVISAGLTAEPMRVVVRELLQEPHFLILWTRVYEAPAALALARICRDLSPQTRILVWGDAPLFMPQYFTRAPFDAAVVSGDPECVLADGIDRLENGALPEHGMVTSSGVPGRPAPGRFLPADEWPFPALDLVTLEDCRSAGTRFAKDTSDLSFYVARGCGIGCAWCVDPLKGGERDRRRPARATIDFMETHQSSADCFQLQSPVFTADRIWIDSFVSEMRRRHLSISFKCCTLVNHLADERLVADLASVGLCSIGFGIETLTASRSRAPLIAKNSERLLRAAAENLHRYRIRGKAFTQIGLANQGRDDVLYTHRVVIDLGLKARPTGATPFHLLRSKTIEELDKLDLTAWDRKSYFQPECGLTMKEFYSILIDAEGFFASTAPNCDLEWEHQVC